MFDVYSYGAMMGASVLHFIHNSAIGDVQRHTLCTLLCYKDTNIYNVILLSVTFVYLVFDKQALCVHH